MSERQMIDASGAFVGDLVVPSLVAASRNYRVMAVVGCQSGGKSTLLNAAFGTRFPVLDAPKSGRRRTTLGVWAGLAEREGAGPIVVLDVEGTDSRERGEGAKAFESRTALFSLALSDVVIVNMWAHDIGRYSAANYELFETVFAHAVALRRSGGMFTESCPVSILIVIRDHDGESALTDIRRVLMGDLANIWDSLKIHDVAFNALFDVDVVLLPHKIYAQDAWATAVSALAARISAFGIPAAQKHRSMPTAAQKPVPLSGFEAIAHTIWDTVCDSTGGDGPAANFTLDIPRHAALAAHFKCGEIVSRILEGTTGGAIDELRAEIESEWRRPVPDFGVRIDTVVRDAFQQYDASTSAYKHVGSKGEAVHIRREELGGALVTRLADLRERYLWVCREHCMNGFEDEFRPMLGGTNGYERNARRVAHSFINRYKNLLNGAQLPSSLRCYIAGENEKEEPSAAADTSPNNGGEDQKDNDGLAVPEVLVLEESEPVIPDDQFGLDSDSEDDDVDEFAVERFAKDVFRMVEDRRRLGELMLPGGADGANFEPIGPKKEPWWKGLLIRGGILLINYLQATQGARAALKLQRQHEKEFPPGPSF